MSDPPLVKMSLKDLTGEGAYFDETVSGDRIKRLLDNVEVTGKAAAGDKVEGMKYLLAQVARGRDVSEFYADVVRNVIVRMPPVGSAQPGACLSSAFTFTVPECAG